MAKIDWSLADKIYAREEDKILEDTNKKEQAIARDCTKRGMIGKTPWLSEMHRAHMDMLAKLAEATINADWEIVTKGGELISETLMNQVTTRLSHRLSRHIRSFMQSAEASITSNNIDSSVLRSFEGKNEKNKNILLTKAKRELEIRGESLAMEEMKRKRFQFLHTLYGMVHGDESEGVLLSQIAEKLEIKGSLARKIATYLQGENLIKVLTFDGVTKITHYGVLEVEEALSKPDEPTRHFLPFNIIHIGGNMVGSQIQQASPGATQTPAIREDEGAELKEVIQSLNDSIDKLQLIPEQMSELQAEIHTIEAQMISPQPKRTIVIESLGSIRSILESATGSLIAYQLLSKVAPFLEKFF